MVSARLRTALAALSPLLAALSGTGCSSPPSELYVLNSTAMAPQEAQAGQVASTGAGSGSSVPPAAAASGKRVGVAVTVPEYLDRLDMIQRTGANELKPSYSSQWGEGLAVTATRAVTEDLITLLPSDDVITLPSRSAWNYDYQVTLDLTRFESDSNGLATLAGRWSIANRDGAEVASARVSRTEQAAGDNPSDMAAAMSRNLASVSTDIATALQKLSAHTSQAEIPPRSGSSGSSLKR